MKGEKIYILVVNPISGGLDKADLLTTVESFANERGIKLVSYETSGEKDEKKIRDLFKRHHPERILVAGGDGTIKMVTEALINEKLIFGILPAGSANGLAVDLNFPTEMDQLLAIAFGDNHMAIDMVNINGNKSLHLSDIGLNAELIKNYENGTIRGKLGYAIQGFTTLKDQDMPFLATIKVKDLIIETDAKMIVIANSNRYGTGVTINPFGKIDDGKFEIVILKNLDLILFGKIITGNMPLDSEDIEIISTETATITTDIPVPFQIDGEYYGEVTELKIDVLHKQIRLAVPAVTP